MDDMYADFAGAKAGHRHMALGKTAVTPHLLACLLPLPLLEGVISVRCLLLCPWMDGMQKMREHFSAGSEHAVKPSQANPRLRYQGNPTAYAAPKSYFLETANQ
jgi:hypothetical protein